MISGAEFITSKTPTWVKFALLILLGVLIISLIRGCHNSKTTLAENNKLLDANKRLEQRIKKATEDSIQSALDYNNLLALKNAEVTINENRWLSTVDTLNKANVRINQLLARYKPVQANTDTNITTVPNEYIADCSQCFTELEGQQTREKKLIANAEAVKQSLTSKINVQELRINQLGREQANIKMNLDSSRAINKAYEKKLQLRRRFYFSMGVMSINSVMPNAAGIGVMYQDKRYRIVGFRMYTSEYGSIKALDIHMPLSFR